MPKYLLAFHGGRMPETNEEGARVMAAWASWLQKDRNTTFDCPRAASR
jgi:hypothetical protein